MFSTGGSRRVLVEKKQWDPKREGHWFRLLFQVAGNRQGTLTGCFICLPLLPMWGWRAQAKLR